MTQPIVATNLPYGSVEAIVAIITSRPEVEANLESRGPAVIQALVSSRHATPAEKVGQVHNALAAVHQVRTALAADPTGLAYSREHHEADDGLVDETLHMQFASGDTSCGLTPGEYRDGCGTANQAAVTCKACIDEMPF